MGGFADGAWLGVAGCFIGVILGFEALKINRALASVAVEVTGDMETAKENANWLRLLVIRGPLSAAFAPSRVGGRKRTTQSGILELQRRHNIAREAETERLIEIAKVEPKALTEEQLS